MCDLWSIHTIDKIYIHFGYQICVRICNTIRTVYRIISILFTNFRYYMQWRTYPRLTDGPTHKSICIDFFFIRSSDHCSNFVGLFVATFNSFIIQNRFFEYASRASCLFTIRHSVCILHERKHETHRYRHAIHSHLYFPKHRRNVNNIYIYEMREQNKSSAELSRHTLGCVFERRANGEPFHGSQRVLETRQNVYNRLPLEIRLDNSLAKISNWNGSPCALMSYFHLPAQQLIVDASIHNT